MSSPLGISGVRVTRSLVLCACFVDRCFSFCIFFLLAIVLSVRLQYTDSDYTFGIFNFYLLRNSNISRMIYMRQGTLLYHYVRLSQTIRKPMAFWGQENQSLI
jgi:hypothetical protein